MNQKALKILEYDKILSLLAGQCAVEAGKEKILTLRPEGDFSRVVRLQKETAAAKRICALKGAPSLSAHPSIPSILERAEKGAVLNPAELLRVGSLLRSVDAAHRYGEGMVAEDAVSCVAIGTGRYIEFISETAEEEREEKRGFDISGLFKKK